MVAAFVLLAAVCQQPSVVVVILDDLGVEMVNSYGVGDPAEQPPTPNLDALAAGGVRFDRAWGCPSCSPARANLFTGRYSFRTGIGEAINRGELAGILREETTLGEVLAASGYETALVGKWHLGWLPYQRFSPLVLGGFQWFAGTEANLNVAEGETYDQHRADVVVPGLSFPFTTSQYDTSLITDQALLLAQFLPPPFFLVVSYHAVHKPFHVPPQALHTQGTPQDSLGQLMAMTEALDTEVGRLVAGLDLSTTTVILTGDNGPPEGISSYTPVGKGKGTTYEGGLTIPLIALGHGVANPGRVEHALVNITDLFATILEMASVPVPPGTDSVSFAGALTGARWTPRTFAYSEKFLPNGSGPWTEYVRALRTDPYKLRRSEHTGFEGFYDHSLGTGPVVDCNPLCEECFPSFLPPPLDQEMIALEILLSGVQ